MSLKIKEKRVSSLKMEEDAKDVWQLALERMELVYKRFDTVFIQFSGGKDSTAVLNVALEVARSLNKLPVRVTHFDEEAIPLQVEDYVRRTYNNPDIDLEWYTVPCKHRNACSDKQPYWYPWNPEEEHLWVRPKPPEGINIEDIDWITNDKRTWHELPFYSSIMYPYEKYGNVCAALGIRMAESVRRRQAVSRRLHENWLISSSSSFTKSIAVNNVTKAYPIYDWQTEDVWTAPAQFGWDYCEAYDVMEMVGIAHHNQRVAPPFGEQPMKGLWKFSKCFPEIWDKMTMRVEGANTAGIYTERNVELYGMGGKKDGEEAINLPEGMSWKEYIIQIIKGYSDIKIRNWIAKKMKTEISSHYKKTSDPILPRTKHFYTGLYWELLAQMAIRGDTKDRLSPLMKLDLSPEGHDKMKAEYLEALNEYKSLGIDPEYSNE